MKPFLIYIMFAKSIQAQVHDFKKDSLQIKVYSTILYKNYTPKKIEILKVFCDYCNEAQVKIVKRKAWDESYRLRKSSEYVLENGTSKLAIYLRFAKTYFRSLNNDERK
jgi:vacuolar-type H+-ATPase catalytic subunit A/Vma1